MVTALLTGQSDALSRRDLWLHSVLIISLWQALRLPHMTFSYQKVWFINTTLYQIFSSLCGKWKILSLCDIWLVLVCSRSHHEGLGIRIHHVLFIFSSWRTNHILLGDWKQPIFRQFYSSKIQIHLTQFFFNKDSINIHQSQSFFLSLARSE